MAISVNQNISPVDALWALFQTQPKRVKREFLKRAIDEENEDFYKYVHSKNFTNALKKAEKEHEEGKCLRFSSAKDAQKWMDEL